MTGIAGYANLVSTLKVDDILPWHPEQDRETLSNTVQYAATHFLAGRTFLHLPRPCGELSATFLLCASGLKFIIHPEQDKSRRLTFEEIKLKTNAGSSILHSIRRREKILAEFELRGFAFDNKDTVREGIEILSDLWSAEAQRPKLGNWREPRRAPSPF
ncbi:MAG: hypothetical protein DI586_02570 [Micavibrio aeruginosavorus]|uniref:Uncharacterized protein n=1 Tax=Micavibrio aeruginosavorus TaxID=349221 RepID=A0A2W5FSK4_9BACT|nr:MAG: hypothetical protein DI586_02570 [Micavibrio aeruginosavorus]